MARVSATLLGGAALICVISSTPSRAQDAAQDPGLQDSTVPVPGETKVDESSAAVADIVVTAQRRTSSIQRAPAAIEAYDAGALEEKSLNTIEDIGIISPSMQVAIYQNEANIYIRGIGTPIVIGGTESSNAFLLDGVYLARAAAAVPGFIDAERIEILKGPQGTLYGRNATGGAINIISAKPTEFFTGQFSASYGNYNTFKLFGAVGGPLVADKILFRLAAQKHKRDGWSKLTFPTPNAGPLSNQTTIDAEDANENFVRGQLEFRPTEDLSIRFTGDYYSANDANALYGVLFDIAYGPKPDAGNLRPRYLDFILANGTLSPTNSRRMTSDVQPYNKPEVWGVAVDMQLNLGDSLLSGTTSYRVTKPLFHSDLDFSDAPASDSTRSEDHRQFSQDLQFTSPADKALSFIVGLSYFHERNTVKNEYWMPLIPSLFGIATEGPCCLLQLNGDDLKTTAYAAFIDASYKLTDRLTLRGGGRYSRERRSGQNMLVFVDIPTELEPFFNNVAPFETATFSSFTPKAGIDFEVSSDVFAYASVTRGFKSGGFNIGSYQNTPYDPEKITSYEIGVKSAFLDRRLRLNITGFYYDYKDLQTQDVAGNVVVVKNAASARIKGVEVDGAFRVSDRLLVDFGATWLNGRFARYSTEDPKRPELGVLDLSGNVLPKAPEFKASVGARYSVPLSFGRLDLRADYTWQDRIFFNAYNDLFARQSAYSWIKARATLNNIDETVSLSAYVDNLTNEVVRSNAGYTGDIVGGFLVGSLAPPRTYGVEVSYRF